MEENDTIIKAGVGKIGKHMCTFGGGGNFIWVNIRQINAALVGLIFSVVFQIDVYIPYILV